MSLCQIIDYCFESLMSQYSCHDQTYDQVYVRQHSTSKIIFFIIFLLEDEQELSLGMLIRLRRIYNFLIVSCQYYTTFIYFWQHFILFFGTNILTKCPVQVPVCCMFFVSQKIHIKQSPNAIKFYGELFQNICDFWEVESTQTGSHSPQDTPGRASGPSRAQVCYAHLIRRLDLYFGCKEAYIRKKIVLKSQRNRSYGSPGI